MNWTAPILLALAVSTLALLTGFGSHMPFAAP
jgi:hypothetical protein